MTSTATQAATARLVATIVQAEALVVAERDRVLADIRNEAGHRALARLAALRTAVQQLRVVLDQDGTAWIHDTLPAAYAEGATVALTDVGSTAVFAWTDTHTAAINKLAQATYQNLLHASVQAGRTSAAFQTRVRKAASQLAARDLARQTPQAAGRALARQLAAEGHIGVTYANGAVHPVASYMEMVARTETAVAYNTAALTEYDAEGVGWLEVFDGPSCFAGSTRLGAYGGLVAMVRSWYDGPGLTIGPALNRITVGPNHPVLTRRGWVRAEALRPSDEILHDTGLHDPAAFPGHDLVEVPTAEGVFQALARGGICRRAKLSHDLHGDAVFGQEEVEVVASRRVLLHEVGSVFGEQFGELALTRTDADLQSLACLGGGDVQLGLMLTAQDSLVSRRDLFTPILLAQAGPLRVGAAGVPAEPLGLTVGEAPWEGLAAPFAGQVGTHDLSRVHRHGGVATLARNGHAAGRAVRPLRVGRERPAESARWSWTGVGHIDRHRFVGWMYDATAVDGILTANDTVIANCGLVSHDDPDKVNGTVRPLSVATSYPISHPNCQRSFGARLDVSNAREAKNARPSTTEAQRADAARVEADRAAAVLSRAASRAAARRRTATLARTGAA